MPFRTALSGLNASSAELRVIGNNVANASTTGFKQSRAEFADIFATSNLKNDSFFRQDIQAIFQSPNPCPFIRILTETPDDILINGHRAFKKVAPDKISGRNKIEPGPFHGIEKQPEVLLPHL